MNTKDKVEAYVRSQIPELKELSFGCEYWNRRHVYRGVIVSGGGDEQFNVLMESGRMSVEASDFENDFADVEIIGHHIQLQHWLEVLRKCGKAVCVRTDGIARPYMRHPGASDEMMEWGVDRHELRFNRDGQPATEADYQALAEIFNIEV